MGLGTFWEWGLVRGATEQEFFLPGPVLAARFRTRLLKALSAEPGTKNRRWTFAPPPVLGGGCAASGSGEKALDYLAA